MLRQRSDSKDGEGQTRCLRTRREGSPPLHPRSGSKARARTRHGGSWHGGSRTPGPEKLQGRRARPGLSLSSQRTPGDRDEQAGGRPGDTRAPGPRLAAAYTGQDAPPRCGAGGGGGPRGGGGRRGGGEEGHREKGPCRSPRPPPRPGPSDRPPRARRVLTRA